MKKETALEKAFWKANLIGEHVDIYFVINSYKVLQDLTESEKDEIYEYIAKRMGLM